MTQDLRGNVERIGRFLGKSLPAETLDAITEHCTFANMKTNPMANLGYVFYDQDGPDVFMRKGRGECAAVERNRDLFSWATISRGGACHVPYFFFWSG